MGGNKVNKVDNCLKNHVIVKNVANTMDQDFVPPDGGWGWMIVISAGISQFCLLAIQQSFGLLFRDRFEQLGITSSEVTVILNVNLAMISFIGLANGVIFKKYSFRKVAFYGSLVNAISLALLSIMTSFYGILLCLSVFYSAGLGITMSANSLALNTYFKKNRRIAVGLCWTCTGLGPIIVPQIITILLPIYGVSGTVLLFSGFALNAVACSLLLQPVAWHAKKIKLVDEIIIGGINDEEKGYLSNNDKQREIISSSNENISNVKREKLSSRENRLSILFGSQYLYYDDEENGATGIDVISTPATPMISRANDGWFSKQYSSMASLNSCKTSKKENAFQSNCRHLSLSLSKAPSIPILTEIKCENSTNKINRLYNDTDGWKRKISNQQSVPLLIVNEAIDEQINIENEMAINNDKLKMHMTQTDTADAVENALKKQSLISRFISALIIFFDLNLLRDYIYTNLMLGINFANFAEMNFAMLTPFILTEYGLEKLQVATFMSVLGGMDVIGRLCISFIATKFKWNNRTFFLIGIGCMATGRIVLAHVTSFNIIIAVGVLIGFGKAMRTIFIALVIPSHVPLSRLPAATGLQLVTSGIISIVLGPVVGWIRDICGSYSIVLHILNILTYLTIISWTLEMYIRSHREKTRKSNDTI